MASFIVCVGVSNYPDKGLLPGEENLEFAADSARASCYQFSRFFKNPHTKLIINEAANLNKFSAVFEHVSTINSLDHFVLYFAGHGRTSGLLLPADNTCELLPSEALADLLMKVRARKITLFIDCCFAGAIAEHLIKSLPYNTEILASTSATEPAWEDKKLHKTIFCAALEQILPLVPVNEWEDVVAKNIESVRKKVGAAAYALKVGARQDVQWFKHNKEMQNISMWKVIRNRVLAIGMTAIVVLTVLSVITMASTYRVAFDESGNIVLKHGPKMLSFLEIGAWAESNKTHFYFNNIVDKDIRKAIIDESILVSKSSKNAQGLPAWLEIIAMATTPEYAQYVHQLSGTYQLPEDLSSLKSSFDIANTLTLTPELNVDQKQVSAVVNSIFPPPLATCGDSKNTFDLFQLGSIQIQKNFLNNRMSALLALALSVSAVDEWHILNQIYPYSLETIKYGRLYGYGFDHFVGANLFILVDAVNIRKFRETGSNVPIEFSVENHQGLTSKRCNNLLNIMKIYAGERSSALERSLWVEASILESQELENSINLFERPRFDTSRNLNRNTMDPFFGIARLIYTDDLSKDDEFLSYWQSFTDKMIRGLIWDDSIDLELEEGVLENAKQLVYSGYYEVFTELAKNGALPEQVHTKLINALKDYISWRATDEEFSAAIELLILLAHQSQYLTQEQYDYVVDITANVVNIIDQRTRLHSPFRSKYAVVRDEDDTDNRQQNIYSPSSTNVDQQLKFSIDRIWGLLSMRGELNDEIKQKLLKRHYLDFFKEPDYSVQFNVAFNRVPLLSRLVAAARLGLTEKLSPEAEKSISDFLSQIIFNDYQIDQRFNDSLNGGFVPKFDDAHMMYNLFSLVLGKHYYESIKPENLSNKIFERLKNSQSVTRQLIREEKIASAWLAVMTPSEQVKALEVLRQYWRNESNLQIKISLANVILGSNNIAYIMYSPEAKLLRQQRNVLMR